MPKVAVIYTSMSGNTKLFAELIQQNINDVCSVVDIFRLEADGVPDVKKYDSLIIGTYTWGKGQLPPIQKDFAYEIQHKPKNVFVFGTGDTQFGEENFCNGALKLGKYYNTELEVGRVEQSPTDSQEKVALRWIEKLKRKLEELK